MLYREITHSDVLVIIKLLYCGNFVRVEYRNKITQITIKNNAIATFY